VTTVKEELKTPFHITTSLAAYHTKQNIIWHIPSQQYIRK